MFSAWFFLVALGGWIGACAAITVQNTPLAIVSALMIYITRPEEFR